MSDRIIVLIIGANQGIGFETAKLLASSSDKYHVLLGSRSNSKGEEALEQLHTGKLAGMVSLIELDVNSDDSIVAAVKKIESDYGVIDVLINNAGICPNYEFGKPGLRDQLRRTFETNVFGAMVLSEAVAPLLERSNNPQIVNISSGLGSIGGRSVSESPYYPVTFDPYRMSKSALNMMTQCQNYNLKRFGVKCWAFCPGYVVTNLTGEEDRQNRINNGALRPEVSAKGIKEVIEGTRVEEPTKFLTVQDLGGGWPW